MMLGMHSSKSIPVRPLPDHLLKGFDAEERALLFLQTHGLTILERNYRVRGGEIDIVAQDRHTLVFVEVRWRKNTLFGGAVESIRPHKLKRIHHAASCYLQRCRSIPCCRIDLLCQDGTGHPSEWLWIRGLL